MPYGQLKECYYPPFTLNKISKTTLDTLRSNNETGIDVKGQEGLDYFDYYEKLVFRYPSAFSMLQINVKKGYSIVTWLRRFPNCTITAVEASISDWERTKKYFQLTPEENARLTVIALDPESPDFVQRLGKDTFDIILDHGHREPKKREQIFLSLFPTKLRPDGMYIFEDIFCDDQQEILISFVESLLPFTYKFSSWKGCKTLLGRKNISDKMKTDWRFTIEDITFRRNIVTVTKESLEWV